MANETELERMVVRLIGDTEQYMDSMKEAAEGTRHAAEEIEEHTNHIGASTVLMGEVAAHAIEKLTEKFYELGREAMGAFIQHEQAEIRFESAIESSGQAVEATKHKFEKFAESVAAITTSSKHAVIGMAATTTMLGLNADQSERAIKNALALSALRPGMSPNRAIRMTAAAEKSGDPGHLAHMLGLAGIKDKSQQLIAVQKALNAGWKTEEELAKSLGGKIGNLHDAFHELLASAFEPFKEVSKAIVANLQSVVHWFTELDKGTRKTLIIISAVATGILAFSAAGVMGLPIVATLASIISGAFAIVGAVLSPMGLALGAIVVGVLAVVNVMGGWEAAWNNIKEAAVGFWEYVRPIFQVFWSVAQSIFNNLVSVATTAFTNISVAVARVWNNIGGNTKQVFGFVKDFVIEAIVAIGFVFNSFADIVKIVMAKVDLELTHLEFKIREVLLGEDDEGYKAMHARIEQNLGAKIKQMREDLGIAYKDFKQEQLKAITGGPEFKNVTPHLENITSGFKEIGKAAHDAAKDATEFGSAEHLSRLSKYFDMLKGDGKDALKGAGEAAKSAGQEHGGHFGPGFGQGQGLPNHVRFKPGGMAGGAGIGLQQLHVDKTIDQIRAESEARFATAKADEKPLDQIKAEHDASVVKSMTEWDHKKKAMIKKGQDAFGISRDFIMDERNYPDTFDEKHKPRFKLNKQQFEKDLRATGQFTQPEIDDALDENKHPERFDKVMSLDELQKAMREMVVVSRAILAKPIINMTPANL